MTDYQYKEVYIRLDQTVDQAYPQHDMVDMYPKTLADAMHGRWYNYGLDMMTEFFAKDLIQGASSINAKLEEDGGWEVMEAGFVIVPLGGSHLCSVVQMLQGKGILSWTEGWLKVHRVMYVNGSSIQQAKTIKHSKLENMSTAIVPK